jgi:hypothetical protein
VNQIAAFKQKHRLQERTSLPDAAVDYFHANWATRAYGADAHGHVVFCERLEWYDVPRLMGRFTEDEQWLATRGVLCEAMERIKGNAGEGKVSEGGRGKRPPRRKRAGEARARRARARCSAAARAGKRGGLSGETPPTPPADRRGRTCPLTPPAAGAHRPPQPPAN